MESNKTANRMHPLVAGAAISVMLVSLTGAAAMTGMFPNSHSSSSASEPGIAVSTSIGAATAATSPAALLAPERETEHTNSIPPLSLADTRRNAESDELPSAPAPGARRSDPGQPVAIARAAAACKNCGRVESIQVIKHAAEPSGVGMVAGAVLGGVLGNQIGDGSGRKIATVAGAVGGGYAGNEVEKRTRASTSYQVRVRMDNGRVRSFPFSRQPAWTAGDRVRVINGQLTARA